MKKPKFVGLVQSKRHEGEDGSWTVKAVIVDARDTAEAAEKINSYAEFRNMNVLACHDGWSIYNATDMTTPSIKSPVSDEDVPRYD